MTQTIPVRTDDVDQQKSQSTDLDANTRVLAQLLATQTEILATLRVIEAKIPTSTW